MLLIAHTVAGSLIAALLPAPCCLAYSTPLGVLPLPGRPVTQAGPLSKREIESSPIVVVKSGPAQSPAPAVSGNGKIGPFTFGALAGIGTAIVVAALGLCVVLSCWCHRRRSKVAEAADAKGSDLPEGVTVGELSTKVRPGITRHGGGQGCGCQAAVCCTVQLWDSENSIQCVHGVVATSAQLWPLVPERSRQHATTSCRAIF